MAVKSVTSIQFCIFFRETGMYCMVKIGIIVGKNYHNFNNNNNQSCNSVEFYNNYLHFI